MLVVHSMWWQLQYGTLRDEIDRRRLERAAADGRRRRTAAHELIAFVYAGHSDWDTPNYSADARCVQAACTRLARACSRSPFPALLRFAGAGRRARRDERPRAGQQQLGGGRHPHALGRRAHRQRHASRPRRAGRLVSGAPARHGRRHHRHHRRDAAGHAGRGRGLQRPGRLGIHQQLWRFRRRALGQVREP